MNVCFAHKCQFCIKQRKRKKCVIHLWCTRKFFRENADQQMSFFLLTVCAVRRKILNVQHECVERKKKMLIITFGTLTNYGTSKSCSDKESRGKMGEREMVVGGR